MPHSADAHASATARAAYQRDGFRKAHTGLSATQMKAIDDALTNIAFTASGGPYGEIHHNPWTKTPELRHLLPALAPIAMAILDVADIVLFQDFVIVKPPATKRAIQWHQDYSYWPLDAPAGVTMWIALDNTDETNGCLHYVPASHLLGERQPANFFDDAPHPARPTLPPLDFAPHRHRIVSTPAQRGDILLHDPLCWHMSPANESHAPRRAWSITWIQSSVTWCPAHAPHPFTTLKQPASGAPVRGDLFPRFIRSAAPQ